MPDYRLKTRIDGPWSNREMLIGTFGSMDEAIEMAGKLETIGREMYASLHEADTATMKRTINRNGMKYS